MLITIFLFSSKKYYITLIMDRPLIFSVWLGKVFYLTKICHQIFTENNYLTVLLFSIMARHG